MRLINVRTKQLEEFYGSNIPAYAILSHCWGEEEVTFQDINGPNWRKKAGHCKIDYACLQSIADGFEFVWVDTCCIDKTSSAELSEAINSMYDWYDKAKVCYVYLEDVNKAEFDPKFRDSRWFKRGWTLQELIAPRLVQFFGGGWEYLGCKKQLSRSISDITQIPEGVILSPELLRFACVATRMSWAAKRQTTRVEDVAYCLLGIFDVNMPLLYGEGERAFVRLQEEIIKTSDDQSIFAWGKPGLHTLCGVLPRDPAVFEHATNITPIPSKSERVAYSMTNKGLSIQVPLLEREDMYTVALLDCRFDNDFSGTLGISLEKTDTPCIYLRTTKYPRRVSLKEASEAQLRTIYISNSLSFPSKPTPQTCMVIWDSVRDQGYRIARIKPRDLLWNKDCQTLQLLGIFDQVGFFRCVTIEFHHKVEGQSFTIGLKAAVGLMVKWLCHLEIAGTTRVLGTNGWSREFFARATDEDKTRENIREPQQTAELSSLGIMAELRVEERFNHEMYVLYVRRIEK